MRFLCDLMLAHRAQILTHMLSLLVSKTNKARREMQATITSKGQVTIPKPIRDALHLSPGDRIEFLAEPDGSIKVVPITASVTELKGMLPPPAESLSLEEMEQAIADGANDR